MTLAPSLKGGPLRRAIFSETPMTPHEETIVLEARDILSRYLSQNPVIGSWQALMDYCALYAEAEIMPMFVFRSLFLAEIAGKGLA
jgi:DNA repair protein RadC